MDPVSGLEQFRRVPVERVKETPGGTVDILLICCTAHMMARPKYGRLKDEKV